MAINSLACFNIFIHSSFLILSYFFFFFFSYIGVFMISWSLLSTHTIPEIAIQFMRRLYGGRVVQNRTNPIEKPQTEPTQTETAKNRIWFVSNQIIFLLNRMVWFGLVCGFHFTNRTKQNQTAT